ncbi:DUF559 domain-containing protein [Microbacterium sp.]|uniref:DUF559 domain-containing protein n=1 Tax=Microbacterium sp. TaxID=51671 RepID=UPI0039E249CE
MRTPRPLPGTLGRRFSVRAAVEFGVDRGRLRRRDLEAPFRGARDAGAASDLSRLGVHDKQVVERRIRAKQYAPLLRPGQMISHDSAVAMWGGPMPLKTENGMAVDGAALPVHVSTVGAGPLVRASGVAAHRVSARNTVFVLWNGHPIASPASAWAQCASWDLLDLVALGDFFCRVHRPGPGRKDVGRRPLATIEELRTTIETGRRVGIARLREAVELVREDSWSPRESKIRCHIVFAGLPEPHLNHDVFDSFGRFLGCVDLAYPEQKVAIEYQGLQHSETYAQDVERLAALRAAGWTVIEVTSALFADPEELIRRIRAALGL